MSASQRDELRGQVSRLLRELHDVQAGNAKGQQLLQAGCLRRRVQHGLPARRREEHDRVANLPFKVFELTLTHVEPEPGLGVNAAPPLRLASAKHPFWLDLEPREESVDVEIVAAHGQ